MVGVRGREFVARDAGRLAEKRELRAPMATKLRQASDAWLASARAPAPHRTARRAGVGIDADVPFDYWAATRRAARIWRNASLARIGDAETYSSTIAPS